MATIKRFEDLEIWQSARNLCNTIFEFIKRKGFSSDRKLADQINASSGSVMDNIAEGFDKGSRKEFLNFLGIAKGSCGETKSQIYRAFDRTYITKEEFEMTYSLADETGRKIHGLMKYLNSTEIKGQKFKDRVEEPKEKYGEFDFE